MFIYIIITNIFITFVVWYTFKQKLHYFKLSLLLLFIDIILRPDQFNFSKHGPDRPCFMGNENKIKKTAVFKKNSNISKTLEVLILKFSWRRPRTNSILTL